MERRDYLELMTGQIRCKKMCPVIVREVEDHIEDQKQAFMAEGMKEEEAEKAAVEEMGDPVEVGVEMDQIHRPKMPWKAIFVIALMQILSGMFAAFYLKQNDVVYVEPVKNKQRARTSSDRQFTMSVLTSLISSVSIITSMVITIVNLNRNK